MGRVSNHEFVQQVVYIRGGYVVHLGSVHRDTCNLGRRITPSGSYLESDITLLVVDDDYELRAFYVERFEAAGICVLTAAGALDARQLLRSTQPDGVILDIGLEDGSGLKLLADLKDRVVSLVVTGLSGPGLVRDALAHGADDVVFKPFKFEELSARLLGRIEARRRVSAEPVEKDDKCPLLRVAINELHCTRQNRRVELSPREKRALHILAEADGEVLGRDELCQQLYGENWDPTSRRVDALISRLRRKLDCSECGAHRGLSTVHNQGYRLVLKMRVDEGSGH